jgi:hypothetical protein
MGRKTLMRSLLSFLFPPWFLDFKVVRGMKRENKRQAEENC